MERKEGKHVTEQARLLGKLALLQDDGKLREVLEMNDRVETTGPILSPTAYGAGIERVRATSDVIRAVLKLRDAYQRFVDVVLETEPEVARVREEARLIAGGES